MSYSVVTHIQCNLMYHKLIHDVDDISLIILTTIGANTQEPHI